MTTTQEPLCWLGVLSLATCIATSDCWTLPTDVPSQAPVLTLHPQPPRRPPVRSLQSGAASYPRSPTRLLRSWWSLEDTTPHSHLITHLTPPAF